MIEENLMCMYCSYNKKQCTEAEVKDCKEFEQMYDKYCEKRYLGGENIK